MRWIFVATLCAGMAGIGWAMSRWHNPERAGIHFDPIGDPLSRAIDDPMSAEADNVDLKGAADFQFTLADGSHWHGFDFLTVSSTGGCEYTFHDPHETPSWKQSEFTIDAGTLAELRDVLADVDFFRLKKEALPVSVWVKI